MSDAPVSFLRPTFYSLCRLPEKSRASSSRIRYVGAGCLLATALLLSGCNTLVPITLTAPPTGASCPTAVAATNTNDAAVLDPKGLVAKARDEANSTKEGATLLKDSLQYVRYDASFIHPVVLDLNHYINVDPKYPRAVIDEAATLVEKATAAATAAKSHTTVPSTEAPSDAIEATVLANLPPWVGEPSPLLPIAALINQLADNAGKQLGEVLDNTNNVIALIAKNKNERNALIGQQTGPALPNQNPPSTGDLVLGSISGVEHFKLVQNLETLASYRAFHVLTLLSAARLYLMLKEAPLPSLDAVSTEVRIFNLNRYLSTYFDAYFRGGQFIQFTADQQTIANTLATDLQNKLKTGLPPAQASQFITDEFTKLCQGPNNASACSATLGQTAFVTRAGLSVQFSGISYAVTTTHGLGLSHSYPQLAQFGPQLIRVLVEALFDANGLIPPSVPNSTACVNKLTDSCLTTGDADEQAKIAQLDLMTSSSEAVVSMTTGAVIRGLNAAALNNEAVAQSIETLMGVLARKIMERLLYQASLPQNTCPIPVPQLKIQPIDLAAAQ